MKKIQINNLCIFEKIQRNKFREIAPSDLNHLFYVVIFLLTATAAYAQKKNNPLSYPYYIYGTPKLIRKTAQ